MKEPASKNTGKGGAFKREQLETYNTRSSDAHSLAEFGSLADVIERVVLAGAYISFGRTRDGGATLVRVLDGQQKLSTYCSSKQELMEMMESLTREYPYPDEKLLRIATKSS